MSARLGVAWRFAALAGLAAGLALAPVVGPASVDAPPLLALACVLALARPRRAVWAPWLALVAAVALLGGLALGDARLAAIDGGALIPGEGDRVRARGTVVSTPRLVAGATSFILEVDGRRIGVESRAPLPASSISRSSRCGPDRVPAASMSRVCVSAILSRRAPAMAFRSGSGRPSIQLA